MSLICNKKCKHYFQNTSSMITDEGFFYSQNQVPTHQGYPLWNSKGELTPWCTNCKPLKKCNLNLYCQGCKVFHSLQDGYHQVCLFCHRCTGQYSHTFQHYGGQCIGCTKKNDSSLHHWCRGCGECHPFGWLSSKCFE